MKKNVVTLIISLLIFCNIAGVSAEATKYPNLAKSPSCEDPNGYKPDTIVVNNNIKHNGNGSFQSTFTKQYDHMIDQYRDVKFEAFKTYYFSAWVKTDIPLNGFQLLFGISYFNNGDTSTITPKERTMFTKTVASNTEWQRFTGTYTVSKKRTADNVDADLVAGDSINQPSFFISVYKLPTEANPTIYFDDIEIRELPNSLDQAVSLIETSPANNADDVSPNSNIIFKYSNLIDVWSVSSNNVQVNGRTDNGVTAETVIHEDTNTSEIIIRSANGWIPNYNNQVEISGIANAWGGSALGVNTVNFKSKDVIDVQPEFYNIDNGSEVLIDNMVGKNIRAKFHLRSNISKDIQASVILALCKGTHIEKICATGAKSLLANGNAVDFTTEINDIPLNGGYYLKAFIWSDIEGILPKADVVELK